MSNLEEVDPEDEPRTYRQGRYRDRLMVVLAGVTVNLCIAFLLFFVVIVGPGRRRGRAPPSTSVVPGSAAARAGLQQGDRIVAVDGQPDRGLGRRSKAAIETNGGETRSCHRRPRRRSAVDVDGDARRCADGQGSSACRPAPTFTRRRPARGGARVVQRDAARLTVGTAEALGQLFSPSGVARVQQELHLDAPKAGSSADSKRPRSIVGIVDLGSDLVGGNLWALLSCSARSTCSSPCST